MYKLHTRKQELYFDEVIRLHYEKGYGEDRISRIIPVGHTTVNRWIRIFAAGKETGRRIMPGTETKEKKAFASGHPMGRDRFREMIDRHGLKIRRRMRAPRTTDSGHGLPTYPNLIRSFILSAPNQLWVSDITYIMMTLEGGGHAFNLRQALKTGGQPSTGIKDIGQQL